MHRHATNVTLIRMESVDGNGPFIDSDKLYNCKLDKDARIHAADFKYESHTRMHTAAADFGEIFTENHFCAYLNLKDFARFWSDELTLIAFLISGFKIYELTVSECHCSNTQAVFLKKDITNKREISWSEISQFYHQKAA